jgi:acetoacetyl-CoA synthetase
MAEPGAVIWQPSSLLLRECSMNGFRSWLASERGVRTADYRDLWDWSVADVGEFWQAIWDCEQIVGDRGEGPVLEAKMPAARWFGGASLNYAEHLFRTPTVGAALRCSREGEEVEEWSLEELRRAAGSLARTLRELGVGKGDRVAAYLPNRPPAVVALIACASIGAVWSVCGPDYGADGVIARFSQLQPKVLIAADGYRFNGKEFRRADEVVRIREALSPAPKLIWVDDLDRGGEPPSADAIAWADAIGGEGELTFERVPFDHPLWVLFSSGTTGVPKGIVHGHGGIVLEHLKALRLQSDIRQGDRVLLAGSTTWMVWNVLVSALLLGATPVLLDGSPTAPDLANIWRAASEGRVAALGVGAGYLVASMKAGLRPAEEFDLSALRQLGSTGSPLPPSAYGWVREAVGDSVWLSSSSGGTEICSAFVGASPLVPVRVGRLQAKQLGVDVQAWDPDGDPVTDEIGELVVTKPMPSMPLRFVADPDGERLRSTYFSMFPGVWRHGDFIEFAADGSSMIQGRSDSTLNRKGVRIGPAEIYEAVEALPSVEEALVVGVERDDGDYYMPLFVKSAPDAAEEETRAQIVEIIKTNLTRRHLPDEILFVPGIPHTRTGKKLEVPIKRILQGASVAEAVDAGAVDDPTLLPYFEPTART